MLLRGCITGGAPKGRISGFQKMAKFPWTDEESEQLVT